MLEVHRTHFRALEHEQARRQGFARKAAGSGVVDQLSKSASASRS
jgi:hypothetical protein